MTRRKPRRRTVDDPFSRACSCGAGVGEACRTVGNDARPLAMRASRLVHADRLESAGGDA